MQANAASGHTPGVFPTACSTLSWVPQTRPDRRAETAHFAAYPSNFGRAVVGAVEKIVINDVLMQAGDKDGPDVEFVEAEQPKR